MIQTYKTFKSRVQSQHFAGILHVVVSQEHSTVEYTFAYSHNEASNLKLKFDSAMVDFSGPFEFKKSLRGTVAELLADNVIATMYQAYNDIIDHHRKTIEVKV